MAWYVWAIVIGGLLAVIFVSLKAVQSCHASSPGSLGASSNLLSKGFHAVFSLFHSSDGSEAGDFIKVACSTSSMSMNA